MVGPAPIAGTPDPEVLPSDGSVSADTGAPLHVPHRRSPKVPARPFRASIARMTDPTSRP